MTDSPVPPGEASDSAEQFEVRLQKRARMLEQGVAPYPVSVGVTTTISDVRAKYPELEPEQATGERVGRRGTNRSHAGDREISVCLASRRLGRALAGHDFFW